MERGRKGGMHHSTVLWRGMSDQGKCIDFEIKSHVCTINHDGSAGKMECEGVKAIYHRSVEKHSLGDADTKSYQEVIKSKPYGDIPIDKAECVGHVQKRVGTPLRDIKIIFRGIKFKGGKCIGGGVKSY